MKLQLKCTQSTKGSGSLRELAKVLATSLGYKVWRTIKTNPNKNQLLYGQGLNKLDQYRWFKANNIPALEFTESQWEALQWEDRGYVVFGRELLNSSCGKGIHILEGKPLSYGWAPTCPVYTKYKKKKREFRVHVFKDKVVFILEKRLRKDWAGPRESKIRNLDNGYVFCLPTEQLPEGLSTLAVEASRCVASDFKGVDIGYNKKNDYLFVFEVNSAPGMQGTTLEKYTEAILND